MDGLRAPAAALAAVPDPNDRGAATAADADDVISVAECAAWLGVNKKTLYDGAAKGELPCGRVGRRILLSRTAIRAWLAGRRP